MSIHDELELILFGAEAFVAYPVHRCSRMLGHYGIPTTVSFVPRVELRQFDTEIDSC